LTSIAESRYFIPKEKSMDSIKKMIKLPFGVSKKDTDRQNKQRQSDYTSKAVSGHSIGSNKRFDPENPTVALMQKVDRIVDALERDMDKNFPNDPVGWMEDQIARGLVTPKKITRPNFLIDCARKRGFCGIHNLWVEDFYTDVP
jgi:hypothetical protein